MREEILKVSQTSVAQALATDYFCIYYVNTDNNKFIEYSSSAEFKAFGLPTTGDDFISFSRESFEKYVDPKDRERFLETFTKANVVTALDLHGKFSMTFRLLFDGVPTYVYMKVTRMIEKEGRHVVVGISSIDEQMKATEVFEKAHQKSVTYSKVAQALAKDYFSIYVVDPDTDSFFEYSATEEYGQLGIERAGEDFFNLSRRNMARVICPDDKERFMAVFRKDRIMSILERDGSFTTKYRLMFGDTPVYVSMKATLLDDEDGRYLIIGTNNIDAQMKREEEYREKVAEARNRARNDFLANMSHDIRTPMNAIVGYTNIARSHPEDPELIRDSLEKIGSSSHFLLSLINDVLDMSKIESGKMQLNVGECDLSAVFRRIEDITSLQAKNKSLRISYDYSGVSHFHVLADELRIEQILINIISNAIKYTPEGKTVEIIAGEESLPEKDAGRYRFIVRDTGSGISEEYLPHIFESFTRELNTTINRIQGTGLGLAITAKVVELMGGTISVKSRLGEGSEFTVELDLESPEGSPGKSSHREMEDAPEDVSMDLSGRRILLVEDNDINAEIAIMVLSQYGLETERASDGQAGVEMVLARGDGYYDAVLMDLQMPVMNGYEAAGAIREAGNSYCKALPIIAMSANTYDEDVRACLAAGMNAHLAKPFQPETLMQILGEHIKG